jgi:hypothetical protein
VRVMTRIRAGGKELRTRCPELLANEITSPRRTLRHLLARPRRWHEAFVYLAVMAVAELAARWLAWRRRSVPWAQDRSSRGDASAHLPNSTPLPRTGTP